MRVTYRIAGITEMASNASGELVRTGEAVRQALIDQIAMVVG